MFRRREPAGGRLAVLTLRGLARAKETVEEPSAAAMAQDGRKALLPSSDPDLTRFFLSHLDAMSVMNQPVAHSVGRSENGRPSLIAILINFPQVVWLGFGQRRQNILNR
jgi:hypothetical protein